MRNLILMALVLCAFAIPAVAEESPATQPTTRQVNWVNPPSTQPSVTQGTFFSKLAGQNISYSIFIPPGYEAASQRYKVVYWLHGITGTESGASQHSARLAKALEDGVLENVLVVFVNGFKDSWYVDSADGVVPAESMIVQELVPHIDSTYRTQANRSGRALEGFSMGGYGSMRLALKYPDLFCAVISHGGAFIESDRLRSNWEAIFVRSYGTAERFDADSPFTLARQNADAVRGRVAIRMTVGTKDGLLEPNRKLHAVLEELKIPHEYQELEGAAHKPNEYYAGAGAATYEFLAQAFKAAEADKAVQANGKD